MLPKLDANKALAELCRRRFFRFVQEFWDVIIPEPPVYNWHIPYLCDELQEAVERVVRGEQKLYDILINIPPGTTKSTIATVMLPAWVWTVRVKDETTGTIDPKGATMRTLTASYGDRLATALSVKSRDIIQSAKYRRLFPEIELKKDTNNKTHYINTEGGERMATSVGGAATGFHAHIIIVDDPIDPDSAESEADRVTANDFMSTTLSTRKVDKSVTLTVLIMQRLHQEDPAGSWLESKKNIKHICLPGELSAEVRPPELQALYVDGLLDPVRLGRDELAELFDDLGSYGYAGQIGQTPTPKDGGIWQEWILPIETEDIPKLEAIGTDWDLAYTKDERNSASAFITAGRNGLNMYITDLGYIYAEFPALIRYMKQRTAPHYIEAKASGKSAKQTLQEQRIPAIEVQVDGGGDKIGRTKLATPAAERGQVFCDRKLLHLLYKDKKQGILTFPNTGTDLNDALVQSINRLVKRRRTKLRRSSVS